MVAKSDGDGWDKQLIASVCRLAGERIGGALIHVAKGTGD